MRYSCHIFICLHGKQRQGSHWKYYRIENNILSFFNNSLDVNTRRPNISVFMSVAWKHTSVYHLVHYLISLIITLLVLGFLSDACLLSQDFHYGSAPSVYKALRIYPSIIFCKEYLHFPLVLQEIVSVVKSFHYWTTSMHLYCCVIETVTETGFLMLSNYYLFLKPTPKLQQMGL